MNEKITESIKDITETNIDYWLQRAFRAGWVLARFGEQLDQFLEVHPEAAVDLSSGIVYRANSREDALAFIMTFGGKWEKRVDDCHTDKLCYTQRHEIPGLTCGGVKLTVTDAPPPPSCRIVEEEVTVPATTRKVKKIVCTTEDDEVPTPTPNKTEDE